MTTKRLERTDDGLWVWVEIDRAPIYKQSRSLHFSGKDPTVDGYIAEKGAIYGHHDKKYHTSKRSYMDSLKAAGKSIDDN